MATPTTSANAEHRSALPPRALTRGFIFAGLLLGIGLGGFVDGILLHQILQWHHMLTAQAGYPADTVAGLEDNTFWDGLFHATTWIATAAGIVLLWNRVPVHHPGWGWSLAGLLLAGWGIFNLVEGVTNHHILSIHNVRDDVAEPMPWNLAFLALGAVLLVVGILLARYGVSRGQTIRRPQPVVADGSNA